MFLPLPPFVIAIFAIVYSVGAAALGVLSGWLTALSMRLGKPIIWKDAFLSVLGFWAGFGFSLYVTTMLIPQLLIGILGMPRRRIITTERLPGGGTLLTTTNTYQHPLGVAMVIAVILPLIYQLYRPSRSRKLARP